jgi:hypothetical protein
VALVEPLRLHFVLVPPCCTPISGPNTLFPDGNELGEMGFEDLDAEDLINMKIHGLADMLRKRKPRRNRIRH